MPILRHYRKIDEFSIITAEAASIPSLEFWNAQWSFWHEVYIYYHKQNTIAIVAVRLSIILGREYLFSPQIEPSVFIFWENLTCCSKTIPFLLRLN
jgi:hypothetical protein